MGQLHIIASVYRVNSMVMSSNIIELYTRQALRINQFSSILQFTLHSRIYATQYAIQCYLLTPCLHTSRPKSYNNIQVKILKKQTTNTHVYHPIMEKQHSSPPERETSMQYPVITASPVGQCLAPLCNLTHYYNSIIQHNTIFKKSL